MRIATPLAFLAIAALPLVYVAGPAVAHGYETTTNKPSNAKRERAEQEAIRKAVRHGELLPLPRILVKTYSRSVGMPYPWRSLPMRLKRSSSRSGGKPILMSDLALVDDPTQPSLGGPASAFSLRR